MLVQESLLEDKSMHETADESDETLSFCDLPLYGDQSVEESQGLTSISSSNDDYFEFFSHELLPSTACFPPENIIFCGKIIPFKKPDGPDTVPSKEAETKQPASIKIKRGWSVFRWRFNIKRSSKTGNNKSATRHQSSKKKYNRKKQGKGHHLPLHKMSVLTSSSSGKARWYLFLTGILRFSSGMELRDIKSRQSRRHSPPPSPTLRVQNHDEKVIGRSSTGSSRLWDVIRLLSCVGNHNPNAMVVGSISCN